jgi:hypothetical protein
MKSKGLTVLCGLTLFSRFNNAKPASGIALDKLNKE